MTGMKSRLAQTSAPPAWFMAAGCELTQEERKAEFNGLTKNVDRVVRNCLSLFAVCSVVLAVLLLRYNPYLSMTIFVGVGVVIILSLFLRRNVHEFVLRRRYAALYRSA